MFEELCGVSYEWIPHNDRGQPAERWCIPSHWVWPRTGGGRYPDGGIGHRYPNYDPNQRVGDYARFGNNYVDPNDPHADELIHYYEVRPWGGMGSAGILRIPPNEMIMNRWPSPINKIDGYSKLAAIAQWIDSEESISKSRWSQFMNVARPEFWVELGAGYEDPDDDRVKRVEAKIASKFQGEFNFGKPLVTPPGAKITPLSFNPTEMAYFQCCSADTECLTADGWKKYTELTGNTLVACYNRETSKLEYHRPSRVLVSEYKGKMYHWKSDDVDLLVTPGHRMMVKTFNKAGGPVAGDDGSWKVECIRNLSPKWHYRIKTSAPVTGDDPPDVEIPMYKKYAKGEPPIIGTYKVNPGDWARFLGWYVSEGNLTKPEDHGKGGRRMRRHRIAASSQKIESPFIPVIEKAVSKIPPYQWNRQQCGGKDNRGCYQWYATDRGLYLHLQKHCGAKAGEKRLPRYVMSWPARLLKVLLKAAISGDGKGPIVDKRGHRHWLYRTTSRQLADDIQEIGIKCGLRCSIIKTYYVYKGERLDTFQVHLSSRNYANVHCRHQQTEDYAGKIWCVTVPTGLFVVRRNGKVHVTGNSEEQIRDMILSTWRVPPAAVGIVREMTYGSILATLAGLCTWCINPRLIKKGENRTKHLARRWEQWERDPERKQIRIWYDDCTPVNPEQLNADIAADAAIYAITPDEVRALRGRKPYEIGGNTPWVQGPGGLMPLPVTRELDMQGLGSLVSQFVEQTQPEQQPQPGLPALMGGEGQEELLPEEVVGSAGIEEANGEPSKRWVVEYALPSSNGKRVKEKVRP